MFNITVTFRAQHQDHRQYYSHKSDIAYYGKLRECASDKLDDYPNTNGCPAVFVMSDPLLKVKLTKEWQYYLVAINYRMDKRKIAQLMQYTKAFCNRTGIGNVNSPRANFIMSEDVNAPLPSFDKDRTCSLSMMAGRIEGDYLVPNLFDGNQPPPLKPNRRHPRSLSEINIDDYLYNPKDHWDLFFAANIQSSNGKIVPFPYGATYDWFFNHQYPVSFLPHVARLPIKYHLSKLTKLPIGTPRIVPYLQS